MGFVPQTDVKRQVGFELPVVLDIKAANRGLPHFPGVVHNIEQARLVVAGQAIEEVPDSLPESPPQYAGLIVAALPPNI